MLPLSEGTELNGKEDGGLYYWEILGSWLKHGKILRLLQICQGSGEAGMKVTCNISAFFPTKLCKLWFH